MIHLSLIMHNELYKIQLSPDLKEFFTPLSSWLPVRIEQSQLILPAGWLFLPNRLNTIPLDADANYSLENRDQHALLMIRHIDENSMQKATFLPEERFTIGRSRSNHICYRDGYLSSLHGVFSFDANGILFYEDKSKNGAFLNGKKIQGMTCQLKHGDILDFPPLVQIIVDSLTLHLQYPSEYAQTSLQLYPNSNPDTIHIAVYFRDTHQLRHLWLEKTVDTTEKFLAHVKEFLPATCNPPVWDDPIILTGNPMQIMKKNEYITLRDGMIFLIS